MRNRLFTAPVQYCLCGQPCNANLVSDAFDPQSDKTKQAVLEAKVFPRLKTFLYLQDAISSAAACACLQNLCKTFAFTKLACQFELDREFDRIVSSSTNPEFRKMAALALHNMSEAIERHRRLCLG